MEPESKKPKGRRAAISALNGAIEAVNLAEKISTIPPAKTVFGSVGTLLMLIKDSTADEADHVELGLLCADICRALDRRTSGRKPEELSRSLYEAINLLALTVADIERRLLKWGKWSVFSRYFQAKDDKETVANWKLELNRVLRVFDHEELVTNRTATASTTRHNAVNTNAIASYVRDYAVNTPTIVSGTHDNTLKSSEATRGKDLRTHARSAISTADGSDLTSASSAPGISPPPFPVGRPGPISDVHYSIKKTHAVVSEVRRDVEDIRRDMLRSQGVDDRRQLTHTSTLGESPPPAPRACFGRDELIEEIVGLTENLTPVALIGVGGIGKTSIALAVLHHGRIKQRFGDNRRFIRCDQFPASCAHLLSRLSKAIGAGIENPEDLVSLRPFLSSSQVLIVLDNAESILDPRGVDAREIHAVVEELSRLGNICLFITSRISTVPSDCKTLNIPTLTIGAARDAFYRLYSYEDGERTALVDNILNQLDFHPLSITLLATVAHHNKWDADRFTKEWGTRRTRVLCTEYNRSLAAAIELSLASPLFQGLGPDARALLGVVAFFPQGVDENNLDWLLPTIPNGQKIFDKFCMLSLTYRANGFITMLAPLRDYISPKDPKSSPLLCATKEHYFTRMSVTTDMDKPDFEKTQWIVSEDINVEHLLDIFTTLDASSGAVWAACANFMHHLFWHKERPTVLKARIEGLSNNHISKPECLFALSQLFSSVGDHVERKQLLSHALKLERERGNDSRVARALTALSDSNRHLGLYKDGIELLREAFGIHKRFGDKIGQAWCLINLSWLLLSDDQLDAAEKAASSVINILRKRDSPFLLCQSHRVLGEIYQSRGDIKKAIDHFEVSLEIAAPFKFHIHLFWVHHSLALLALIEDRLNDANAHIGSAKSHAVNSAYSPGHAMYMQARVWYLQNRLEEAKCEALGAADIFERLGAVEGLEMCKELLRWIEEEINGPVASYLNGELLKTAPLPAPTNSPWPLAIGVRKASDGTDLHIYPDVSAFSSARFGEQWFNAALVHLGWISTSSSQGPAC